MRFYEVLTQIIGLLALERRVSYQALKRRFDLDDAYLTDVKAEIVDVHRLAVDQDGTMLVWTGGLALAATPAQPAALDVAPAAADRQEPALASTAAPPVAPAAERRQVTVLFCDLVDSTKVSRQLDPEDYRTVIHAYQETAVAAIQPFDGYVAQYLGDGLLLYFGWPQAHEDAASRAVHASLALLDALGPLNTRLEPRHGVRVAIRIGLHTGLAVIGTMGSGTHQEALAMGDTPNIAARIQGLGGPNTAAQCHDGTPGAGGLCAGGIGHPSPQGGHGADASLARPRSLGGLQRRGRLQSKVWDSGEAGIGKSRGPLRWRHWAPITSRGSRSRCQSGASSVPWRPTATRAQLTLSRLERLQSEALITHLGGGKSLPVEVVQHIVAKTDGVPLFVEELTKMLLESELLREEAEHYALTGSLSTAAIPATLQDSLMARLDRLPAARDVAQLGAVLGREFSYDLLRAVSPLDEATLQARLAQLVAAELLYQRGRPPRATYIFKHALIQDAAYASLLRSTRQQYHQRVAHVLLQRAFLRRLRRSLSCWRITTPRQRSRRTLCTSGTRRASRPGRGSCGRR